MVYVINKVECHHPVKIISCQSQFPYFIRQRLKHEFSVSNVTIPDVKKFNLAEDWNIGLAVHNC